MFKLKVHSSDRGSDALIKYLLNVVGLDKFPCTRVAKIVPWTSYYIEPWWIVHFTNVHKNEFYEPDHTMLPMSSYSIIIYNIKPWCIQCKVTICDVMYRWSGDKNIRNIYWSFTDFCRYKMTSSSMNLLNVVCIFDSKAWNYRTFQWLCTRQILALSLFIVSFPGIIIFHIRIKFRI